MKKSLVVLIFCVYWSCSQAQTTTEAGPAETHHYAIDIAGIRVGTMTAVRQVMGNDQTVYTLISDVNVNLLVYTIKIYYKVINRFEGKKMMLSTVDVHTNRGDFTSRTEWKGDHYDISANQYKYKHQAVETQNIDFSSSLLYFYEPLGRNKVYAEYFGDYFTLNRTVSGTYHATIDDRADDYIYQNGRLIKVIKHNSVKNFIVRLLD